MEKDLEPRQSGWPPWLGIPDVNKAHNSMSGCSSPSPSRSAIRRLHSAASSPSGPPLSFASLPSSLCRCYLLCCYATQRQWQNLHNSLCNNTPYGCRAAWG